MRNIGIILAFVVIVIVVVSFHFMTDKAINFSARFLATEIKPYEDKVILHNGVDSVSFKRDKTNTGLLGFIFGETIINNVFVTLDSGETVRLPSRGIKFKYGDSWILEREGEVYVYDNREDVRITNNIIIGVGEELIKLTEEYTILFGETATFIKE